MFKNWNAIRALAFVLVTSLALVTVAMAKQPIMGTLRIRENRSVQLNGATVKSGMTVFSGATISCPKNTGATVDLPTLGRIDVAPNTRFVLTFSENLVSVRLESGYVVLSTNKGVDGTVTTDDGRVVATDSSKESTVIARTLGSVGPEASMPVSAAGGLGAGPLLIVGGTAGAILGEAAARSSDRPKPLSPSRPNQ